MIGSRRDRSEVKRHELLDHLRRHGCVLSREGGRHSIFSNPATGAKVPVPRHAEIDNRLARKICDQLGIPSIR
jgi:predicted RNA binding protein YcfA (HicA-like mRNA interferase family)